MIRFSFTNMLKDSFVSYAQAVDPAWSYNNALTPERPFKPFKSLESWGQIFFDFGHIVSPNVLAAINVNTAPLWFDGFQDVGATILTYSGPVTCERSANGRRHHGHRVVGVFGGRILRVIHWPGSGLLDPEPTPYNYNPNPSFENWSGGLPVAWYTSGAGSTLVIDGVTRKTGATSAKLTRVGADCFMYTNLELLDASRPITWWRGRTVYLSAWVNTTVASVANVGYNDGTNIGGSAYHTGGGTWQQLTTSFTVANASTAVLAYVGIGTTNATVYIDDLLITTTPWSLGGVWVGTLVSPPRDIAYEPDEDGARFYQDVGPPHGGWAERLTLAPKRFRLNCRRLADNETELAAWRAIDRLMDNAGFFLVCLRENYPEETYVMRCAERSPWTHKKAWSESTFVLDEVVTP